MKSFAIRSTYRKALKLAAICDQDLLCKSFLTPPLLHDEENAVVSRSDKHSHEHHQQQQQRESVGVKRANTAVDGARAQQDRQQRTFYPPPIPLSTSITDLVRSGFRTPTPRSNNDTSTRLSSNPHHKKESTPSPTGKKHHTKGGLVSPQGGWDESAAAAAFFAIRWMQQSVNLAEELRRIRRGVGSTSRTDSESSSSLAALRSELLKGESSLPSARRRRSGSGAISDEGSSISNSSSFPSFRGGGQQPTPPFVSMPIHMSPTETLLIDDKGRCMSSASFDSLLGPTSVLYTHPSVFDDKLYRSIYVCADPNNKGWGPTKQWNAKKAEGQQRKETQASALSNDSKQGITKGKGKKRLGHGTTKSSAEEEEEGEGAEGEDFPIICVSHKSSGIAKDLLDAMPELFLAVAAQDRGSDPGDKIHSSATSRNISACSSSSSSAFVISSSAAAAKGALNIIGRLPVFIGGPSSASPFQGPYLVHSNHTIAYLLASARGGALGASRAVARPFYVERLVDVLLLPVRVLGCLNAHNCRVVAGHYKNMDELGRGVFLHDACGRSAPIAMFGIGAALMTPAAAAAIAAGRAPYPALPPNHNDWSVGLFACGLASLGSAPILSAAQRAAIRDVRAQVWEGGGRGRGGEREGEASPPTHDVPIDRTTAAKTGAKKLRSQKKKKKGGDPDGVPFVDSANCSGQSVIASRVTAATTQLEEVEGAVRMRGDAGSGGLRVPRAVTPKSSRHTSRPPNKPASGTKKAAVAQGAD